MIKEMSHIKTSENTEEIKELFSKYALDYSVYQKGMIFQVAALSRMFEKNTFLLDLNQDEFKIVLEKSYLAVAKECLTKAALRQKNKNAVGSHFITKKVNFIPDPENTAYMEFLAEYQALNSDLTETDADEVYNSISVQLNYAALPTPSLTGSEAFSCLLTALGWGGGAMSFMSAFQNSLTAAGIQQVVITATKFIMRNLGWFGAAVTALQFANCLWTESND